MLHTIVLPRTHAPLRYYWEQMLEAVQTVHDAGVVHADIKPNNFVLVKGHLKLIDFGLAVEVPSGRDYLERTFVGGTRDYLSPESLACYIIEDGALDVKAMRRQKVGKTKQKKGSSPPLSSSPKKSFVEICWYNGEN